MSRRMKVYTWVVAAFLMCAAAPAMLRAGETDDRRAAIAAANADAVRALQQQVGAVRIGRTTVQQLVVRTNTEDQLLRTLQRAEQIGGPRWIDDQTCQVRLEIPGDRVAATLIQIATTNPRTTPIDPQALARELSNWSDRTFSATGSAIGAGRVDLVRPTQNDAWSNVDENTRKSAVSTAKQNAADRVLDSVRAVNIDGHRTVGDVLKDNAVERPIREWLVSRPVTALQYDEDRIVRLTLAAPREQLFNMLIWSAQQQHVDLPDDPAAMEKLHQQFVSAAADPNGRAVATTSSPRPTQTSAQRSGDIPDWVSDLIDAEGSASDAGGKLRTARAAESAAMDNLRSKILSLPLTTSQSIGAAADKNDDIRDAVNHAMLRARTYRVDYLANGGATVKVSLDGRALWDEIDSAR